MNDRIFVKLTASETGIFIRTVSRQYKSPHSFFILREKLKTTCSGGCTTVDIHSFADLWWNQACGTVRVRLCWLNKKNDELSGTEQTIWLPFDAWMNFISASARSDGPRECKLLSLVAQTRPRLIFVDQENLRNVLKQPILRKKLIRFLRDNFNWAGSTEIRFYNDFDPYSFCFREFFHGSGNIGLTGGLILHRSDDWNSAYYSVHT